jgi:predicted kinase
MTKRPVCHILVGLPGVGKSTWSLARGKRLKPDFAILSTDGYIEWVAKQANKTYDEVFASAVGPADSLFWVTLRAHARSADYDIYIDRTNMTPKGRKKIIDIVKKSYDVVAVVFTCDPEEHLKRLRSRPGKTIPPHAMASMEASYREPTTEEGFRAIWYVNENTFNNEFQLGDF